MSEALADFDPVASICKLLQLPPAGVAAVVSMLAEGNTVPFIARYRKERTGGLDEVQIRDIEEKRTYLIELEERRRAILASIGEQGKLTSELEAKIKQAMEKAELEDLYAPYRPRRKTRASTAKEKGLEPLALLILAQGESGNPLQEAQAYVSEERQVATAADALAGAKDIVAEMIADGAPYRTLVRQAFANEGELVAEVVSGKAEDPTKFEQYYGHREPVRQIPSHRFLAIRRGEAEGVLRAHIAIDAAKLVERLTTLAGLVPASPYAALLSEAVTDAYKRLLAPSIENDVRADLKMNSDVGAAEVFAHNLRDLLLSAPLGNKNVVGIDPGVRTGCKCAAIDETGKFLDTITVYISQGDAQLAKANDELAAFLQKHKPVAIAVGNGTGGREAEAFARKVASSAGVGAVVVAVNEAGASVYSASDIAREEFPDLDLTIRGAISIARRLQDPLAELVKIEPKSIGVGQYQHDVHQPMLGKKLGDVVESCVNHVGVDLNTASAALLAYVAGIGKSLAKRIVAYRDDHGAFAARAALLKVTGLGPKAFEQAAGFLRIRGGEQPLDASAVHPERYTLIENIAGDAGVASASLIGNAEFVDKIDFSKYVDDAAGIGAATLADIKAELVKPGRDPRAAFDPPKFREDVTTIEDLKPGMQLEGLVSNVTAFGAFVDIGVHNDGLVHISQLGARFVKDASEVVKVGQKVNVRVLEIDLARKRIALTMRQPGQERHDGEQRRGGRRDEQAGRPDREQRPRSQGDGGNQGRERQRDGRGRGPAPGPKWSESANAGERGPRREPGTPNPDAPRSEVNANGPQTGQEQQAAPRDRGNDQRGPRPEQRRDGGPRDGGPRRDDRGGPPREGQRTDGGNDRGPRRDFNRGPDNRRPDDRGPRRDNARGPRRDGPRDNEQRQPPPNFGIAGFTNSPFAALAKKPK